VPPYGLPPIYSVLDFGLDAAPRKGSHRILCLIAPRSPGGSKSFLSRPGSVSTSKVNCQSHDPKGPLFPKAFSTVAGQFDRVGTLSNQFHDVMVEAGLVSHRAHAKKGTGRAGKRLGAELSFHCLRHTATSLMKEAGIGTGAESSIRFPQSPTRFPAGSVSFRSVWPTDGLR
jgi:hypothetical protein